MSRNFHLGSRNMKDAGRMALQQEADQGTMSLSSVATHVERWSKFVDFAKEQQIGRMERVTPELVRAYAATLVKYSPATAQNLISAINTVMSAATRGAWQRVSPVANCNLPRRTTLRESVPAGLDPDRYGHMRSLLQDKLGDRAVVIVDLTRELGLRSKEASLLDARTALRQAQQTGQVQITLGTKGGQARELPVTTRQMDVLRRAAVIQGAGRGVMPNNKNWREWREGGLRAIRETVQLHSGGGLHDLRAAYACQRYQEITGHPAPVETGGKRSADRDTDHAARLQIAEELGHHRVDVVAAYIGGRR